jgi:hypothetical protein
MPEKKRNLCENPRSSSPTWEPQQGYNSEKQALNLSNNTNMVLWEQAGYVCRLVLSILQRRSIIKA